ncbi:MAG: alkaline phosphatase family protein, partial [Desulfovibrio sp.]
MNRILFVLLDGLTASTARRCLSYPQALEEGGQARYVELECFLPPLSRPTYTTLLCGLPPAKSGIMHNDDKRACPARSIFAKAQNAGLVTAAAAYYWMSELCNTTPFDPASHRLTNAPGMPIEHGLFYSNDDYPDNELFNDAAALCQGFEPDLLMLHTMGIDYA